MTAVLSQLSLYTPKKDLCTDMSCSLSGGQMLKPETLSLPHISQHTGELTC